MTFTPPAGFALVPLRPEPALLRPFFLCPPEELPLAWGAMHAVAVGVARRELAANDAARAVTPSSLLEARLNVEQARGFVAFGAGVYKVTQTKAPGLVVTFRADDEMGYQVGDRAPEVDTRPILAEAIVARLQFTSVAGLDSLEQHLREIRAEHWPETVGKSPALSDSGKQAG